MLKVWAWLGSIRQRYSLEKVSRWWRLVGWWWWLVSFFQVWRLIKANQNLSCNIFLFRESRPTKERAGWWHNYQDNQGIFSWGSLKNSIYVCIYKYWYNHNTVPNANTFTLGGGLGLNDNVLKFSHDLSKRYKLKVFQLHTEWFGNNFGQFEGSIWSLVTIRLYKI